MSSAAWADFFLPEGMVVESYYLCNPREKCNVLDVFMRCVLEVFERVLAIYSTVLKVFYTFLECLELGPGINETRNT